MSQSSISKGSERTAGSRFNLQALLIRYRQSFASQAANVIAMLVLMGWGLAVQNFTLLPHNKIDYSGEGWLNSELWLSPIETGADWHRFTLHGILYDVIWAEDRWLAVTSEGDIVAGNTSGDWNSRHKAGVLLSAIDRDTRSGRIVAVGYGKVVYSDDLGDSWSSTSLAEPVWFSDLAHNGSEWVAVGDPGIWRSSDGVNWRRASGAGVTEILYSVAAGEGKWLAGGENGLYTSDDGENWRWLENASGENAGNVFSVAYGNGLWVASFSEGVKVSRDGTNWRSAGPERAYQQKQPVEREQEALYFYSLAEHDGLWLGVSDLGIYASYDGLSWQQTSNPASTGRNMVSLAFNGERWLVVGDDLVSSGDGLQWQKAVSASPTGTLYSVWAEAEHWVAVGSGSILSSRDGLNWRAQSRPEKTGWLYDVAFNGSAWLAVGEKNILRSSDGENWQPVETLAKQGELYAIGHYNGRWVVVGESDLLTSRDGLRWQAPEGLSLEEGDYLMDVTWGAGRWVAVGDQGILVSENGEDWNWLETVETIDTLNGVAYSEAANLFVVVGNEEILVSRNGIDWQWVENNPQTDWLKGISWANGRWVAVGDADILVSENGESWTRLENLPNTGWLEAIASDAEKWLAVGDMGLFVSERSDPTAWKKASGYRTFAPPLSLLAYLLALVSALIFVRQLTKKRIGVATPDDESASNEFISDRAIHSLKEDRLNRAPVALALSKFIRNRESSKPFTLAVSGDWGSGKSSLMGMISSDLKKMGLAPVWFNAWHCQDMNLLSGLVRAMQEQGMPKPWELRGMVFRLLLLFRKIRFAHVVTAVVLALVAQYAYTLYASKTVRAEIFSRYVNQPVFFSDEIVEQLEKKSKNCPWQSLRGETFEKRRELFSDVTVNKVVNNSKPAAQKTQTPAEINITTANKNIVLNELCQHKLVSYFDEQLSTGLPYIMRVAQQKIGPSIIFVGTFLGAIASLISGLGVFGFNMRFKSTLDAAAEKDPAALSEVKQRLKDIAISLGPVDTN